MSAAGQINFDVGMLRERGSHVTDSPAQANDPDVHGQRSQGVTPKAGHGSLLEGRCRVLSPRSVVNRTLDGASRMY